MTKKEYTEEDRHEARMQVIPQTIEAMQMWQDKMTAAIAAKDYQALAQAARYYGRLADQLEYAAVNEAYYKGATWEQIGEQYGISRQAAQQRFGGIYRDRR